MKAKPSPKKSKAKSFSVSLPADLFTKATKEAFNRGQSFSGMVRALLLAELEASK